MTDAYVPKPRARPSVIVVPHPHKIRHTDAVDVAEMMLDRIEQCGHPLALFLHTDGRVETCAPGSWRMGALVEESPRSLVGVYSRGATEALIVGDLKAREE